MRAVQPTRLDPETRFKFRCYPGIGCFTRCCSNIDIMLTPYDVLRMTRRLGISSEEFLDTYTTMRIDEKSSHPYAYLKLKDDDDRLCPFVTPEGCTIYTDRPASCRYYPVGQATMKKRDDAGGLVHEEFYFFVKEKHCQGFREPTEWTVQSWREDQEAEHYDAMNREWKDLLMRRNLPGGKGLDPRKQTQFFMASYDLDRFRRYVFESRFLKVFEVSPEEAEKMRTDDVALMKFAFRYLKYLLMMEKTLSLREGAVSSAEKQEEKKGPGAP
ncbi:MAG: YkgJ family cysteine cluster protein [Nitrospirota bacterium]